MAGEPIARRLSLSDYILYWNECLGIYRTRRELNESLVNELGVTPDDIRISMGLLEAFIVAVEIYLDQSVAKEDSSHLLYLGLARDFEVTPIEADLLDVTQITTLLTHWRRWKLASGDLANCALWDVEFLLRRARASSFLDETTEVYLKALCAFPRPQPFDENTSQEGQVLVTLDQAAGMVHRSKRTLERHKTRGKLPTPTVEGGGGRADFWDWDTIRPWLETTFNLELSARFPASRRK